MVLGGDGTHRAVVRECGEVPIAGISTGTNNAFPEHREPTITGLAVGLCAYGPPDRATQALGAEQDARGRDQRRRTARIALVDVVLSHRRFIGARALWRTETFRELYVTFADPEVIGMSAIAGLLEPVAGASRAGCTSSCAEEPARGG